MLLPQPTTRWPSVILVVAGFYNLAWAAWMIASPRDSFFWAGLEDPAKPLNYPQLWQGLGLLVGVFGLGYLFAASNPVRHGGIVLVGLVSKVFGGLASVIAAATGQGSQWAVVVSLFNDMIWWVPFLLVIRHAHLFRRVVV